MQNLGIYTLACRKRNPQRDPQQQGYHQLWKKSHPIMVPPHCPDPLQISSEVLVHGPEYYILNPESPAGKISYQNESRYLADLANPQLRPQNLDHKDPKKLSLRPTP